MVRLRSAEVHSKLAIERAEFLAELDSLEAREPKQGERLSQDLWKKPDNVDDS